MARPKRKKIKFDESSVNSLLQEIYNESHNIKGRITRLFNKWEVKVKESGEVAAIGDQIVKLIAAEAKNQDQKIMLLKYLKEVVYINTKKTDDDDDKKEITTEDRTALIRMAQEELLKKNK